MKSETFKKYKVAIYSEFSNFRAFHKFLPKRQMIWNETYITSKTSTKRPDTIDPYKPCKMPQYLDFSGGMWATVGEVQRLFLPLGKSTTKQQSYCVHESLKQEFINDCFVNKYKKSFTMIGDSHIRYAFHYSTNITGGGEFYGNAQHNLSYDQRTFFWVTTCSNLVIVLEEYLSNQTSRNKDSPLLDNLQQMTWQEEEAEGAGDSNLLILGLGSWDIDFTSTEVRDYHRHILT